MKKSIKIKRLYAKINKIEMEILALQEGSELPVTLADLVDPDEDPALLINRGGLL